MRQIAHVTLVAHLTLLWWRFLAISVKNQRYFGGT